MRDDCTSYPLVKLCNVSYFKTAGVNNCMNLHIGVVLVTI